MLNAKTSHIILLDNAAQHSPPFERVRKGLLERSFGRA